jgi:hypothetical protein
MKPFTTFLISCFALVLLSATASAQVIADTVSIRQIQEVHPDTLSAGNQNSPMVGDTVTVEGVVYAAPRVSPGGPTLFALGNAFTLYIMDEQGGPWSGLNVRASDSTASNAILVTAVDTGYVIRVTGVVTQYFSTTQFEIGVLSNRWNADVMVEILDDLGRRPDPTEIAISDLVNGGPQDGIPMAQQWEGVYVVIHNAKVGSVTQNTSTGRYTWTITDDEGNAIGVYDQSIYFRGGSQGFDPAWAPPTPGTTITAMRGVITSSGQGIVIAPLYPGDLVVGSFPPAISNLGRDISIPNSTQDVTVTCTVEDTNPDGSITQVQLIYGIGDNEIDRIDMNYDESSLLATGVIPAGNDGDIIWYYVEAMDNDNESAIFPGDMSRGKPFFIVRDGDLRIRDIQYTPFANGNSGAIGGQVTLRGVVTAGSSDLGMVFMQDATDPWSGIMLRGDESIRNLTQGQDVTVTGVVEERFSVTTVGNASVSTDHGIAPLPEPVLLTTGEFENAVIRDGNPNAEQWEGMLTTFGQVTVTSINADAPTGNFGEFLIDDGSGDMRVDDAGKWDEVYTLDSTDTNLIYLRPGSTIQEIKGVMHFSFSNWKLLPRDEDDFTNVVTSVEHRPGLPEFLSLAQNYPNPFNAGLGTSIQFDLPRNEHVTLRVYDITGRLVATLLDSRMDAGTVTVHFTSPTLPSGIYMYTLSAGTSLRSGRMAVTR